jgi:hypothetical protein
MNKVRLVALTVAVFASGCSYSYRRTCDEWKRTGEILSTPGSCVSCVETLGSGNIEAIRGCAIGLDAAKLVSPEMRAPSGR